MSYIVQCPSCKANLRAKVKPISEVSCPKCKGLILPEAEPMIAEPEQVFMADLDEEEVTGVRGRKEGELDDREEDGRRRRRQEREDENFDEPRQRRRKEVLLMDNADAFVSTTRIQLHGTIYATANITSVRLRLVPNSKVVLIVWGVVLMLAGGGGLYFDWPATLMWVLLVLGLALFLVGLSTRQCYQVVMATAAAEFTGYRSTDGRFCHRLVNAIENAIAERG